MNKTAIVTVLALGLGLGASGVLGLAAAPVDGKQLAAPSEKMKALLKERLEAAQIEINGREEAFKAGKETLETLLNSAQRVFKAQLELSEKKADQVATWEAYLRRTREIEEICKHQYEAGRRTILDYMQAKYARLDAEIGLERAKSK